jgi:hypothetical protein
VLLNSPRQSVHGKIKISALNEPIAIRRVPQVPKFETSLTFGKDP